MTGSINQSIRDKGVCRTASYTGSVNNNVFMSVTRCNAPSKAVYCSYIFLPCTVNEEMKARYILIQLGTLIIS